MEIGTVQPVDIEQEMRSAYLDYAISVIVARALPDTRDGLKPVHRRILYATSDLGLRPNTHCKKSAISAGGMALRAPVSDVPRKRRATVGEQVMELKRGDEVASVAVVR